VFTAPVVKFAQATFSRRAVRKSWPPVTATFAGMQIASRHAESSRCVLALTLHDDASIALPLNSSLHSREKPGAAQKEAGAVGEAAAAAAKAKAERAHAREARESEIIFSSVELWRQRFRGGS